MSWRVVSIGAALTLLGGFLTPGIDAGSTPASAADITSEELEQTWVTVPNEAPTAGDPVAEGTENAAASTEAAATAEDNDVLAQAAPETAIDSGPSTASVVPAPAGSAVLSVRVGGDRQADGSIKGLAGVKLGLYTAGTATTDPGAGGLPAQGTIGTRHSTSWTWTTCVSDGDGDCSFIIPIRDGAPSRTGVQEDTRFWVAQEAGPNGWYANPKLRIGSYEATPEVVWNYRFRTTSYLKPNTTYLSTRSMEWAQDNGNPDWFFMRNRVDTNTEGRFASNITRTTGIWNQSRVNPGMPEPCPIDVALIVDTSGSLGTTGMSSIKKTLSQFIDAFSGTASNMALFSFSEYSPAAGTVNHPGLLPVNTTAEAAELKALYSGWVSGGGTNWDQGIAAAANADEKYDVAFVLTDGNPTVEAPITDDGGSAFNSLRDIDAGIFSANQLKSEGTRVVAVGIGPQLTPASELNLRAISGTAKGSDYLHAATFDEASKALVEIATKRCQGSIGVQKMIVPNGGTIQDATPAPAGWQFDASAVGSDVTVKAATSQTTVEGGDGKVDFGLTFAPRATSGVVQVKETQQAGYALVQVDGQNAVCTNTESKAAVTVTNLDSTLTPGFEMPIPEGKRIECIMYNRAPAPGALEVAKTSNPASGTEVKPGQEVSYTLVFKNRGGLPVTVNHEDVLNDVLDDAALKGNIVAEAPLAAALSITGDRILITGELPAHTTTTVTYTVKINDPLLETSNGTLGNFIVKTGEEPPEECLPYTPCTVHPIVGSLSWNKVNDVIGQAPELLNGSEWKLTPYTSTGELDDGAAIEVIDCHTDTAAECASGPDTDHAAGKFLLTSLTPGKYQLRETKAPAGYQLLADPIDIVINTAVAYGDIKNSQINVPAIPLTGGMGSLGFWGAGAGLALLMAAGVWVQRRRTASL